MALPWLTNHGLVAQYVLPENAVGPLLRFELFDNFGLQGGALYRLGASSEGRWGWFASLDYMYGILEDLSFK